jgi:hypothetical protein
MLTRRGVIALMLVGWVMSGGQDGIGHAAKSKPRYRLPDLKILSVESAPVPFVLPSDTPLILTIMVELPKTLPDDALLDVTTMITSTSRYSIRLITSRQMLTDTAEPIQGTQVDGPRTVEIVQAWDGTDHTKRVVTEGTYDYQVQAKLMVVGKDGPLTRATAWKKRGNIEVRSQPASHD